MMRTLVVPHPFIRTVKKAFPWFSNSLDTNVATILVSINLATLPVFISRYASPKLRRLGSSCKHNQLKGNLYTSFPVPSQHYYVCRYQELIVRLHSCKRTFFSCDYVYEVIAIAAMKSKLLFITLEINSIQFY
ncbi:hypothetical protein Y032_0076g995 [Ancylostoma ceylanicum]|uniref:Uncharacterized protein n=1 Tax=Ancylostoma ceylanicum TaxID=53326 RepID=A0A016TUN0_9BILA|nr:hypothetical protein Y032_0076g995 [Ancylostoma ceylanicum]